MVSPFDRGGPILEGLPHAVDCGAWATFQAFTRGERSTPLPDLRRFTATVQRYGRDADFIVIPDIVMGGELSWHLSQAWLRKLRRWPLIKRVRLMIAVQNGFDPALIEPFLSPRVGVFVGGDTDWKLSTMADWASIAHRKGGQCHVGRVNTARRIALCGKAGIDSFDGTSATKFAVTTKPLERARYAAVLERCQIDIEQYLRGVAA
jgi:hypothetical protein